MELSLNLSPRLDLRLENRLKLEQRLEQKLAQQLELRISLGQYLEIEDGIKELVSWTNENDSWKHFDREGFDFQYAGIPYHLAKPYADRLGFGFAHCVYDPFEGLERGDWTLFVVEDMVPPDLRDFVAIHERGEEISLANHYFASQLEFALMKKRGKTKRYTQFIDEWYPTKFVDLTQEVLYPILPQELIDYLTEQGRRNEVELRRAKELISQNPLPTIVLNLMDKYETATDNTCRAFRNLIGQTQHQLETKFRSSVYTSPEESASIVSDMLSRILKMIDEKEARVISRVRVNPELAAFDKAVNEYARFQTHKNLFIPSSFDELYSAHQKGEPLVAVAHTPEDLARRGSSEDRFQGLAVPA